MFTVPYKILTFNQSNISESLVATSLSLIAAAQAERKNLNFQLYLLLSFIDRSVWSLRSWPVATNDFPSAHIFYAQTQTDNVLSDVYV